MTSRSVSPPTPEPERDEAHSAQIAEMRGRAVARGVQDAAAFAARCVSYLAGADDPPWADSDAICGKRVAQAAVALADQVEELRSALEEIASVRCQAFPGNDVIARSDCLTQTISPGFRCVRCLAVEALAHLASSASALPEGPVTPEERRTRAEGVSAFSQRAAEMRGRCER